MKKLSLIFGTIACTLFLFVCAGAYLFNTKLSLDMDAFYADYQEVVDDGAITRGWIPGYMPRSATNIQESHNLDINISWLRFTVPAEDIDDMTQALLLITQDQVKFSRPHRRVVRSWWPKDLQQQTDMAKPYRFYRYDDHYQMGGEEQMRVDFIAVDVESGTVYYWMP